MSTDFPMPPELENHLAYSMLEASGKFLVARSADPRSTWYHYTTAEGLINILKSGSLWATHVEYLNDPNELAYGLRCFKDEISKRVENLEEDSAKVFQLTLKWMDSKFGDDPGTGEYYVTSFTEAGDLLSQWRAYADGGRGYSIGLHKVGEIARVLQKTDSGITFSRIAYDSALHMSIANQLVDAAEEDIARAVESGKFDVNELARYVTNLVVKLSVTLKKNGFFEENEARIFTNQELGPDNARKKYTRPRNGLLVPYIKLDMTLPGDSAGLMPLKEVIIGPKLNYRKAKRALTFLLQKLGYDDVQAPLPTISQSETSLD